jgi:GNAT superfamily N-acetyltransferase
VRRIVESTGFFYPAECDVAVELVEERLAKGEASGYYFVFAELDGRPAAYACYGPIACTVGSFDLFWIAVDQEHQRVGLGRRVLEESERLIRAAGGRRVYIETSNRAQYQPTRTFYERCGYHCEAVLKEFYGAGDDKVVYVKALPP